MNNENCITLNEIKKLLDKYNIHNFQPPPFKKDEYFNRNLIFMINSIYYYITWYKNYSILSIGSKNANTILFKNIKYNTTWPRYKTGLEFVTLNNDSVYIAIKELTLEK